MSRERATCTICMRGFRKFFLLLQCDQNPVSPLVSIHTPTRGATAGVIVDVVDHSVSIHAPTRGATLEYNAIISISALLPIYKFTNKLYIK